MLVPMSSKAWRWSLVGSDVGGGGGVADLVAGEGGQVVEQAAEATVGGAELVVSG
jgi:hypothetical protein